MLKQSTDYRYSVWPKDGQSFKSSIHAFDVLDAHFHLAFIAPVVELVELVEEQRCIEVVEVDGGTKASGWGGSCRRRRSGKAEKGAGELQRGGRPTARSSEQRDGELQRGGRLEAAPARVDGGVPASMDLNPRF